MRKSIFVLCVAFVCTSLFATTSVICGIDSFKYQSKIEQYSTTESSIATPYTRVYANYDNFDADISISKYGVLCSGDCSFVIGGAKFGAECEMSLVEPTGACRDITNEFGIFAETRADVSRWLKIDFKGVALIEHYESTNGTSTWGFDVPTFGLAFSAEAEILEMFKVGGRITSYQEKTNYGVWFNPSFVTNEVWVGCHAVYFDSLCLDVQWYHVCEHPERAWNYTTNGMYNRSITYARVGLGFDV